MFHCGLAWVVQCTGRDRHRRRAGVRHRAVRWRNGVARHAVCVFGMHHCSATHPLILFTDCLCGCVGVQLPFPIYTGISVVDGWSWFDRRAFDMLPPGLELLEDDFYGLIFKQDHYELRKWRECVISRVVWRARFWRSRYWPCMAVSLCLRHQHYLTCLVPGSDCSADSTYVWKAGTCIFFGEHNAKYSFQEHVDECVSAGGGPVTFAESDDYVLFQTRLAEHESASGRQYNAGLWIGLSNRVYAIDERVGGTSGASGVVRASEWARTPRRPVRSTLTHACVCHAGGTAACRKCGDIECCWKAVRCGHHGIHVAGRAVR